jgi:hypothetical protein
MVDSGTDLPAGFLDLREMWTSLLDGTWNSLALVPTDHPASVQSVVDALVSAAELAKAPVRLIDARGVDVAEGMRLVQDLVSAVSAGSRAVVVVDSIIRSLSGVHLVKVVDAIVLVVQVGAINVESATSTVDVIGSGRILGSVAAPF